MSNLRGYVDSYIEHSNKIANAIGDPTKVHDIRGWIKDCRHFARKAYDESQKYLRDGDTVPTRSGNRLDRNAVEKKFSDRMDWLLRAERENEEIARRY